MTPFHAWMEAMNVAWRTQEMLWASAQTIGLRMTGIALAGPIPDARQRRENARMVREKMDAAWASTAKTATALEAASRASGPQLWTAYWRVADAALTPYHSRARANARRLHRRR